jgi:monovalent cation:H+ antiporter-2, CPA2 family
MPHDISLLFIELGVVIVGLAVVARLSSSMGFSTIPLYLLAGLAFGKGGLSPLPLSQDFIHVGAEIGVLLLLFMLGLEYTGEQLKQQLQTGLPAGLVDLALNFPPGVIAGFLLGWSPLAAVLLGGVTYISSSGVIAKILVDAGRLNNRETPAVMSVLVLEDLAMAAYLPLVAVLITGGTVQVMIISVAVAITLVLVVLFVAIRYGQRLSRVAAHESDEVILLSVLGTVLLVAGLMQRLQVSAAIGAFLVGTAISGPIAEQSHRLLAPLRDLFAATFFFFFGLEIDPASLVPVFPAAIALGVCTALTKVGTGYWAARRQGVDPRGRWRAGAVLIARGEFSIVIAGLGVGFEPRLGPFAAAYVLLLAIGGPVVSRLVK